MLDKDKLILVVTFGIDGFELKRAREEMLDCRYSLISQFDDSVKIIVIPDKTAEDIRVETINPRLLNDKDYHEKVLPIIDKAEQIIKDFKLEKF